MIIRRALNVYIQSIIPFVNFYKRHVEMRQKMIRVLVRTAVDKQIFLQLPSFKQIGNLYTNLSLESVCPYQEPNLVVSDGKEAIYLSGRDENISTGFLTFPRPHLQVLSNLFQKNYAPNRKLQIGLYLSPVLSHETLTYIHHCR